MIPPETDTIASWERPILIVGAGRSGTNLLAMALDELPDLKNVYEQRYVWTKGAKDRGSDIRGVQDATQGTIAYIRRRFKKLSGANRLIDKTPSNSLRVNFCREVFPEGQIIHVVRNPFDNIASRLHELKLLGVDALDQSKPEPEPKMRARGSILADRFTHARTLLARRNIPLDRLPSAVLDQVSETCRIALIGQGTRWGERVPGTEQVSKAFGVEAALAYQWLQCTAMVRLAAADLSSNQFLELRYEDLVLEPDRTGSLISAFLGVGNDTSLRSYLTDNARPETVNRYRDRLSSQQIDKIRRFLNANTTSSSLVGAP